MRAREGKLSLSPLQPGLAGQLLPSNGAGPAVARPAALEPKRSRAGLSRGAGRGQFPRFFKESDLRATEAPGRPSLAPNNIF